MNNKSNCYYNSAYSNYYDEIPDVQQKEDYYESENETFVDGEYDEYFQNLKYQRNRQNQMLLYGNAEEERCLMRTDRDINSSASILYTTSPIEYSNSTSRLLSATSTPRSTSHLSRADSVCNPVRRCLENSMENKKRSTSAPGRKACARAFNNKSTGTNLRRSKSSLGFSHQKLNGKEFLNRSMSYVDSNGEYYPKRTQRQDNYYPKSNMAYSNQGGSSCMISLPVNSQTHGTFLPKPRYADINSSFTITRPLGHGNHAKNMAVIPPTYARKPVMRSFEVETPTNIAPNTSASSPLKISWMKLHGHGQSVPMCTLRTSAVALLISAIISCLLCFHMISERGKSYELDLSLLSSFVSLFLGVPCFRFEQWRWLPNRNYVSGYIVLSIFSILQMMALFFLSRYPNLNHEITDVTKGALSATSALSIAIASLGICTSCCCKYPPPDNRVAHAAEGFTV